MEVLEDRRVFAYDFGAAFALGGEGVDLGSAIAVDSAGNTFLGANYNSASIDLDPGVGTYVLPNAGWQDGLVAKYDPTGNVLWGVHFGSATANGVTDLATDGSGNVFVAGYFAGSLDIGVPGNTAVSLTNAGVRSGFLAKLDSSGSVLWANALGTAATPRAAQSIAVDAAGNAYVTGSQEGNYSFHVAKYSSTGSTVWTKVVSEGTGVLWGIYGVWTSAYSSDVAVDDGGNVYVTGSFVGNGVDFNPDPKKIAKIASQNGDSDAFVLKLNASGGFVWVGSMGGPIFDGGQGIAVDANRNVYINGYASTSGGDYDPGRGKLALASGGFVVKLDTNRNLLWGRSDVGQGGMAVDGSGAVYTTDGFSGTIDADPGPGTFTLSASGTRDIRVTKLDSAGNFVWAGAMGGTGYNSGEAIAIDGAGSILTTGHFGGTADFDPNAGTYPLTSALKSSGDFSTDIFVSKLVPAAAMHAANAATAGAASKTLGHSQVEPLLSEALARWQAEGVDTSSLIGVDIHIADLGGTTLGLASGNTIWLDDIAAGWDWFVDATPWDDSEFTSPGNQGEQNRMDLLTVVMHELGHLLGHDHDKEGVMAEALATGVRRTGLEHDDVALADQVFGQAGDHRADAWLHEQFDSAHGRAKRRR